MPPPPGGQGIPGEKEVLGDHGIPPGDVVTRVWREQSPQLVGGLYRMTHDLELAEDFAADALLAALEQWPGSGVPDNPAGWLMAVAKRRAVDHFRRAQRLGRVEQQLARELGAEESAMPEVDPEQIEDDVLRLMLVSCHPVLTSESQVALTLRLLGGLTTREIARSFMVPEPTIVRRITRAKRSIAETIRGQAAFELPAPAERLQRLPSVLHVIYLIFTEGYSATTGDDLLRPALCDEAIRLGRLVGQHFGADPEVHGLLALMYLQASRATARVDRAGDPVLLADQDRGLWDQLAIRCGLESLQRAFTTAVSATGSVGSVGVYTVQAAVAACHAQATALEETDWQQIAGLYNRLAALTPSPVVRLNRAVAHGMAFGPAAGLELVDEVAPELPAYHLLPSVRGDLLARLGRPDAAVREFEAAAAMARNVRERDLLLRRAEALRGNLGPPV